MKKILLIEDNPYDARLVGQILKHHDCQFNHAKDASSGLELAVRQNPDIILLDMGLPDLDGQTVMALLQQMEELQDIPVVAVTAWPPDTAREMAEAYGCAGYISKPIKARQFYDQIAIYFSDAEE